MWKVQLCELYFDQLERDMVSDVLSSEWLTMGDRVATFENNFSDFHRLSNSCVAVSSATAGLHLILMALGVGPGDEVIVPGLTFVSDANVVCQLGAKPIFADSVGLHDLNVSTDSILDKISSKTKVIIVVHFAGFPKELSELKKVCEDRGIFLVEDVAHAPGAMIDKNMCGTLGDAAFYSFFSNKNLAVGEGGMVLTKDVNLLNKIRRMRSHGMTSVTLDRHKGRADTYRVNEIGLNYRLDEIRAAIGIVQLQKLQSINDLRGNVFKHYVDRLKTSDVLIPFGKISGNIVPAYHIMPIMLPKNCDRAQVINFLREAGIQTSIHYPAFHTFSAYQTFIKEGDLPVVDEITRRELTLPLHPRMTISDVNYVCKNLIKALKHVN